MLYNRFISGTYLISLLFFTYSMILSTCSLFFIISDKHVSKYLNVSSCVSLTFINFNCPSLILIEVFNNSVVSICVFICSVISFFFRAVLSSYLQQFLFGYQLQPIDVFVVQSSY